MMNSMMSGLYGGFGMFASIFFWLLIIIGIVLLINWITRQSGRYQREHEEESALDIVKKRYARGEISREDYEQIKKDIS